jgi:hypothetical protein
MTGVLIIITPEMIVKSVQQKVDFYKKTKDLADTDNRIANIDGNRIDLLQKYIFSYNPKSNVPLLSFHYRCAVSDEFFDPITQFINVDWTFYTVGTTKQITRYPTLQIFDLLKFNSANSLNHDKWRILNDPNSGLYIPLCYPKDLLRKVTLVIYNVTLSTIEKNYLTDLRRIQQVAAGFPMPPTEVSSLLLGCDVFGESTRIPVAVQRLLPMNREDAINSCKLHFESSTSATVAQRFMISKNIQNDQYPNSSFVQRQLEEGSKSCQVCMDSESVFTTLCGHSFCNDCSTMIRHDENQKSVCLCPACRCHLSAYDWININPSVKEVPKFTTSKFKSITNVLCELFSKRRPKKRLPLRALLIVPDSCIKIIPEQLSKEYFEIHHPSDIFEKTQKPYVLVSTMKDIFENHKELLADESLEGILFAQPQSVETYYKIIRANSQRMGSVQAFVFYCNGYESIEETKNTLLSES